MEFTKCHFLESLKIIENLGQKRDSHCERNEFKINLSFYFCEMDVTTLTRAHRLF